MLSVFRNLILSSLFSVVEPSLGVEPPKIVAISDNGFTSQVKFEKILFIFLNLGK